MHPRIMHRRGSLNHIDKAQELTCECRDRGSGGGKSEISNSVTSEKSKRIFRVRLILVDGTDEIYTGERKRGETVTENERAGGGKQTTFVKMAGKRFVSIVLWRVL